MPIRICLAKEADCENIARMSRKLVEHDLPWTWTQSRVRYHMRDRECAVIVARSGRTVVGFSIMQFYDEHAHLNLLAVNPGYQNLGIGRMLVEWLEESARTAGIFLVRLELRADNEGARSFYRRLGYEQTGVSPQYYDGREDAVRMTHDLSLVSAA